MSMFSFRKREKTPVKASKLVTLSPTSEPSTPTAILEDAHIIRILELEEKVGTDNYTLKHVEDLVQLYAVFSNYPESGRVLRQHQS